MELIDIEKKILSNKIKKENLKKDYQMHNFKYKKIQDKINIFDKDIILGTIKFSLDTNKYEFYPSPYNLENKNENYKNSLIKFVKEILVILEENLKKQINL